MTGKTQPAFERSWVDQNTLQLDVAENGTVAYLPRRPGETQSLVYVDRDGKIEPVVPEGLPFSSLNDPRVSPDGNRVAYVAADAEGTPLGELIGLARCRARVLGARVLGMGRVDMGVAEKGAAQQAELRTRLALLGDGEPGVLHRGGIGRIRIVLRI